MFIIEKCLLRNNFEQLFATDMVEAARKYMMERHQEVFKASTSDKIGDDVACIIAKLPGFDEIKVLKDKEDKAIAD
ncbi:MAG: hypothetical protein ACRYGR_09325 [Janthinobacterium lividum]